MVRKKKKREAEQTPWCYYCDRIFADESTLIQHQKAKHFKCTTCHRKLTSASGLRVHCHQVHRFTLDKVPAAIPGKDSIELEVFGMSGVPEGASPGMPPEEDKPSSKVARTDAGVPTGPSVPQIMPPLQLPFSHFNGMLPAMPPHPLQPAPAAPMQPSLRPASGSFPYGLPPPAHRVPYAGVAPPWPPPPFMHGLPSRPPGMVPQQPAFPIVSAQTAGAAAPLFPLGMDRKPLALKEQADVSTSAHSTLVASRAIRLTPEQQSNPVTLQAHPPGTVESLAAHDTSVEEVRAQHPKYASRVKL